MCGRYVSTSTPEELVDAFRVDESRVTAHEPDYNVAPRAEVYAVRDRAMRDDADETGTRRYLDLLRWGLVPSWAQNLRVGDRMINARAEGVATKPAYRRAFERHRCLLPADGFYEWQRREGRRTRPFYVRRADGEPMAFAGLWAAWRDPAAGEEAPWLRTCTVVTTDANERLAPIHDRMPVVLAEGDWDRWLDPTSRDLDDLRSLLRPAPASWFEAYPVGTRVNRASENDPGLLEPAPAPS